MEIESSRDRHGNPTAVCYDRTTTPITIVRPDPRPLTPGPPLPAPSLLFGAVGVASLPLGHARGPVRYCTICTVRVGNGISM
jgi:hypothetical protein